MGKIWYRKLPGDLVLVPENSQEFSTFWVVPVSVREKIGLGKKYQYRYWKNKKIVLERSTGTGKIWSRKKVSVLENILGTVTLWGAKTAAVFLYLHTYTHKL